MDAVRVADRYDRGAGGLRGQVCASVGDAVTGFHILDGAELRLQGHGRFQTIGLRRAHRRIGLVAVQTDARPGEFEMDLRAVKRGRGIGQMPDFRGDARLAHPLGELVERGDLLVGRVHEFRYIRRIGDRQMTPLADNLKHAFLGERYQLVQRHAEALRGESVTAESGVDFHMNASRTPYFAGGCGERVDAGERADGNVDVVGDQLVERDLRAVIDPSKNAAAIWTDTGFAQQQRLMRLRGAKPRGASRKRCEGGWDQAVAVGVRLDDTHDGCT